MPDAAPTTALPVPDGSADEAWRETSMLYFRAAVERLYWQDIAAMHLRVTNCGNIPPRCIPSRQVVASFRRGAFFGRSSMAKRSRNAFPRRPTVARSRRNAFSGCRPWQYFAAVRFRGSSRGEIMPWCVPGRRSVAAFSLHAFPKGPRTGKAPVRGKISPPCIRNEPALARYSRHASEKRRKQPFENTPREDLARKGPFSLRGPLRSCTACGSCRRSALAGRWALCVEGWGRVA